MKPVLIMLALFILSVLISKRLKKIDKKFAEKRKEFYKGKIMKKDVQEWYNEAMNRNN